MLLIVLVNSVRVTLICQEKQAEYNAPRNPDKNLLAQKRKRKMPNQKKKQYSAEFKAQVVKEILKEEKTISQLSAEYGIHSSQLYKWRDHVLSGLPNLFNEQAEKNLREKEAEWQEA